MLVWLVTIGEPLPVQEGEKDRPHRTGLFARLLAERGHEVVWWTSTYDHFRRKHLFAEDHALRVNERLEIRLLHGCGYRSNVSLARFRDHRQVAGRFAAAAQAEPRRPDIIVAALPTIELCLESARYGKRHGVPVVLDMRDMWPDVFLELLPRASSAGLLAVGVPFPAGAGSMPRRHGDHRHDGRLRRLGSAPRRPAAVAAGPEFSFRLRSDTAVRGKARGGRGFLGPAGDSRGGGRFQRRFLRHDRAAVQPRTGHRGGARLEPADKNIRFVLCGAGDRLERTTSRSRPA